MPAILMRYYISLVFAGMAPTPRSVTYRYVDSPVGELLVTATERGVVYLAFACEDSAEVLARLNDKIGPVSVLGESSVGSGARRIEAYSGMDAFRYYSKETALVEGISRELKIQSEDLPERIAQLTEKLKAAEKQIDELHKARLMAQTADMIGGAITVNGFTVISVRLPNNVSGGDLRTVATDIKNRLGDEAGVVALASENEGGKTPFIVGATKAAVARGIKAGDLVKTISGYVDGKGGGKPDMAQGSGANAEGLQAAFNALRDELEKA